MTLEERTLTAVTTVNMSAKAEIKGVKAITP